MPTESVKKDAGLKTAILWLSFLILHAFVVLLDQPHTSGYNILSRTWGLNNISYYSLPWILLFYLVNVVVCIPAVNEKIYKMLEQAMDSKLFRILASRKFVKYIIFLFIGLGSVGIFWLFRIKYNFLGDMDIRVKQSLGHNYLDTQFLSMYIMDYLHKALNLLGAFSGYQVFQWTSYCAGGAFVVLLLLLSDTLIQERKGKVLLFLFSICIGTLQVFFGYVEVYYLPALSVLLYFYTGILYIKRRIPGAVPVIVLFLAIGLHLLSVALIPSLAILFFYQKIISYRRTITHFIILTVVCIPIAYIAAPLIGRGHVLIPFSSDDGHKFMTLLSPVHFWEYLNSQILAGGLGLILFILVLLKNPKYDHLAWFFITGGIGMLYITFINRSDRGSGDWDINAFPAIGYNIAAIYIVLTGTWSRIWKNRFRYLIPIFLVFNAMSVAAWVGINASDRSITKIEHMIIGDPGFRYQLALPDYLSLASNYEGNGLKDKSIEILKKAYIYNSQDPRAHYSYAGKLIERNQPELGLPILENLIIIAPQYPNTYNDLIAFYAKTESSSDLYRIVTRLFSAYLQNPESFKSVIGLSNLKQTFTSLRDFESSQGNTQRAQFINQVLSQL